MSSPTATAFVVPEESNPLRRDDPTNDWVETFRDTTVRYTAIGHKADMR
jgi:hypothetical protein